MGQRRRSAAIARDLGLHALSVDLAGGYVARFLGGDPGRWRSGLESDDGEESAPSPRIAAIHRQEHRFDRLAERYRAALARSDPAALALLERVCMFRYGVTAGTLTSIFTWDGKEEIAGTELAQLDESGVRSKLAVLAELKLVVVRRGERGELYGVHPAVRDCVLQNLDEETARRGHQAASEELEASLGDLPDARPHDPTTLDLLEEIVFHVLSASRAEEAWDIYWNRIREYQDLGHRTGTHQRGERICRAFAGGLPPRDAVVPAGLPESRHGDLFDDWALYSRELGRLEDAAHCYRRSAELRKRRERWSTAAAAQQKLARVLLLAGHLAEGSEVAAEVLGLAERAGDAKECWKSRALRAQLAALRGETDGALEGFNEALQARRRSKDDNDPLGSLSDLWHAQLLARLGDNEKADQLARESLQRLEPWGPHSPHKMRFHLLLADLACERDNQHTAERYLGEARSWAAARDAKEVLCWSNLVDARTALEDGLRIARDCGFSLFHIELLLLWVKLALDEKDAEVALDDLRIALEEGVAPSPESDRPASSPPPTPVAAMPGRSPRDAVWRRKRGSSREAAPSPRSAGARRVASATARCSRSGC